MVLFAVYSETFQFLYKFLFLLVKLKMDVKQHDSLPSSNLRENLAPNCCYYQSFSNPHGQMDRNAFLPEIRNSNGNDNGESF